MGTLTPPKRDQMKKKLKRKYSLPAQERPNEKEIEKKVLIDNDLQRYQPAIGFESAMNFFGHF